MYTLFLNIAKTFTDLKNTNMKVVSEMHEVNKTCLCTLFLLELSYE